MKKWGVRHFALGYCGALLVLALIEAVVYWGKWPPTAVGFVLLAALIAAFRGFSRHSMRRVVLGLLGLGPALHVATRLVQGRLEWGPADAVIQGLAVLGGLVLSVSTGFMGRETPNVRRQSGR